MKLKLSFLLLILFVISTITAISFAQRTRDTDRPITGDFKITFKQSMGSGQEMQSTTMIKGLRERSETSVPGMPAGMAMVSITECDLKRTIQINDRARKYMVTPMETGESEAPTNSGGRVSGGPSRRGGVVTMTAPLSGTRCVSVSCASPVPGGRSMTMKSSVPHFTSVRN